jgi:hypothetical protein
MLRLYVYASEDSADGLEMLVTVIAPGMSEADTSRFVDRRIANTRDRKPVWIRPRRGVREGAPAARQVLYRARVVAQNPDGYLVAGTIRTGMSVFSSV